MQKDQKSWISSQKMETEEVENLSLHVCKQ